MVSATEFGKLRAFIAVAEILSFTRAAARLSVSPSALSQILRALEERTGTRLLNRTTRSVSLTEAGGRPLSTPGAAKFDTVTPTSRIPLQGGGTVRIRSRLAARSRSLPSTAPA